MIINDHSVRKGICILYGTHRYWIFMLQTQAVSYAWSFSQRQGKYCVLKRRLCVCVYVLGRGRRGNEKQINSNLAYKEKSWGRKQV